MNQLLQHCDGSKDHKGQYISEMLHRYLKKREEEYRKDSPELPDVAWLKAHDMELTDGFYVMAYTGSSSSWLNAEKRNGQDYKCACKAIFAEGLENALMKVKPFHGQVYRMEECDDERIQAEWFAKNIGITFHIPYYLSTAIDDYDNTQMVWVIQTHPEGKGREIATISNAPGENEVLFSRGSKFIIIGADLSNLDKVIIYMEELPSDTETDLDLCGVYYRNF
jgi:hypothetical protein